MIYINYDGPASSMLHIKFRGNRPTGSGEEDFLKVFAIYSHGGHLGNNNNNNNYLYIYKG